MTSELYGLGLDPCACGCGCGNRTAGGRCIVCGPGPGCRRGPSPANVARHSRWLEALGHKPLPDGRCEHRWKSRQTRAVRCAFLAGFRAALTSPATPDKERVERAIAPYFIVPSDHDVIEGHMRRCLLCGRTSHIVPRQVSPAVEHTPDCAWHDVLAAVTPEPVA